MIVPVATPLTRAYEVDIPALKKLCQVQIEAGINVLFMLGTTGEFYGLTPHQRREVVDAALETAAGQVPVIVGVSGDSTRSALSALAECRDRELAGYVVSTPYFLNYDQDELFDHFRILSDALGELSLILYNYPHRYRHVIEVRTIERLLEENRVMAIKDTAGDFGYFQKVLGLKRAFPNFLVFEGALPNLAKSARLGIDGSVQAIGNLLPRQCALLWSLVKEQNWDLLEAEVEKLWKFHLDIETVAIFIAALKGCMALRGLCLPLAVRPTRQVNETQTDRLCHILEEAYGDGN